MYIYIVSKRKTQKKLSCLMSVHDAAWHTGLFFYVLVRPLLIGTGGLSKWRKSVIAQSGCWARVAAGRRARHTGVRSPRRKQQSCVQTTAEVLAKKKKVCVDLWTVSVLLWLHGPSVTCFDAAVKAVTEHFGPELSSVMMLNFFLKSVPSGVITRLCQTKLSLCLWSTSIISRRRCELCVLTSEYRSPTLSWSAAQNKEILCHSQASFHTAKSLYCNNFCWFGFISRNTGDSAHICVSRARPKAWLHWNRDHNCWLD